VSNKANRKKSFKDQTKMLHLNSNDDCKLNAGCKWQTGLKKLPIEQMALKIANERMQVLGRLNER
jgi:hypothetical protein